MLYKKRLGEIKIGKDKHFNLYNLLACHMLLMFAAIKILLFAVFMKLRRKTGIK
jgi:hypothetical protein